MTRHKLAGFLLALTLALGVSAAPVAAGQAEAEAINALMTAWFETSDPAQEDAILQDLADLEVELAGDACSQYAGYILAGLAIVDAQLLTGSPYLEQIVLSIANGIPAMEQACVLLDGPPAPPEPYEVPTPDPSEAPA